jgi:hypothetical protein
MVNAIWAGSLGKKAKRVEIVTRDTGIRVVFAVCQGQWSAMQRGNPAFDNGQKLACKAAYVMVTKQSWLG